MEFLKPGRVIESRGNCQLKVRKVKVNWSVYGVQQAEWTKDDSSWRKKIGNIEIQCGRQKRGRGCRRNDGWYDDEDGWAVDSRGCWEKLSSGCGNISVKLKVELCGVRWMRRVVGVVGSVRQLRRACVVGVVILTCPILCGCVEGPYRSAPSWVRQVAAWRGWLTTMVNLWHCRC